LVLGGSVLVPLGPLRGLGTVLLLVVCVNGINMIDGQDGLASGLGAIAALGVFALAGHRASWGIVLAAALAGSLCGLLGWNRPPARIFLGNSGPGAIGVVLVAGTAALAHADGWRGLLAGGACLGVFLFEVVFTLLRRRGRANLMTGDRLHSYDLLAAGGGSRSRVTLLFWGAGACLVGLAAVVRFLPLPLGVLLICAAGAAAALWGGRLWSRRPRPVPDSAIPPGAGGEHVEVVAVSRALTPASGRYLVTGAAGFIGSHLVDELLTRGHSVIAIDAFRPGYDRGWKERNLAPALAHPRLDLREQDLLEADLEQLVLRVDGVFHLAAQPGVRTSWGPAFAAYARDNLLVSQRLFEAAAGTGRRVAVVSSSSVYGDAEQYPTPESAPLRPVSPYGVTKVAVEQLAAAYERRGLDHVLLRYFTVYGPRQRPDMAFMRIAWALLAEEAFGLFGDGEQLRDVTYVADVVAATIAALDGGRSGAVYNVGSGRDVSLSHAISVFEELFGRRLRVQVCGSAAGDMSRTLSDSRSLCEAVGWQASTSLEQGIAAQLAWAQQIWLAVDEAVSAGEILRARE
jgi:nucleoside-diphosphate-sugar epimerase